MARYGEPHQRTTGAAAVSANVQGPAGGGATRARVEGKRYNREKRQDGGHGDQKSVPQNEGPTTAERLATAYNVAPSTIERDGEFAEAVDALGDQVRADIKEVVLKRQACGGDPTRARGRVSEAVISREITLTQAGPRVRGRKDITSPENQEKSGGATRAREKGRSRGI